MSDKRIPITRVNKFFGDEDFRLHESLGMEYLSGNLNFTLVLFRVDRSKSNVDDVYGEATEEGEEEALDAVEAVDAVSDIQ